MIALAERSSPVESLGIFRSFPRGSELASRVSSPPIQAHNGGTGISTCRSRDALEPARRVRPESGDGSWLLRPRSSHRLRRSQLPLRSARQPIKDHGSGPRLLSGPERRAGERLEVLGEASVSDLLEG